MRNSVVKFADAMEAKLQEHDTERGETGWRRNKNGRYLQDRLLEEVAEYFLSLNNAHFTDLGLVREFSNAIIHAKNSISNQNKKCTKKEQKEELLDIGNFAMMLYDNLG